MSRRELLRATASLLALASAPGCTSAPKVTLDDLPATAIDLPTLVTTWFCADELSGLALLGESYARRFEHDAALTAEISALLRPIADLPEPSEAMEIWEMSLESDFEEDRAPLVRGWVLGRTEARLCVLARALIDDGRLS